MVSLVSFLKAFSAAFENLLPFIVWPFLAFLFLSALKIIINFKRSKDKVVEFLFLVWIILMSIPVIHYLFYAAH